MLVAHDKDGNRIYANSKERFMECFCPDCGKPLSHKIGKVNRPYFAHRREANCLYGTNKDSKSEWHIHMQELFPLESLEVRFRDDTTGELHIADVYLQESKTVVEFQHSPISAEEFVKRTLFHVNNGRRIVLVFDERGSNPESEFGRLRKEDNESIQLLDTRLHYKWPRSPRKMLSYIRSNGDILQAPNYSVCVYYGEEDIVHRVIGEYDNYCEVDLSVHPIKICGDMDVDEFFISENHWLSYSPWKEMIEKRNQRLTEIRKRREEVVRQRINSYTSRKSIRRQQRL